MTWCTESVTLQFQPARLNYKILIIQAIIWQLILLQGDSLARGPTEVYLQIFYEFVNQLTDDELTTGYYQQDGATCHTSNASMQEIESFFKDRIISKNLWPPRSPDLCWLLSLGHIERQSVQKYTQHNRTPQRHYTLRDWSRQHWHFGNSIPEFGETHSSVFGCEMVPGGRFS